MLRFTLEPDAAPKLAGYMEHVRARIISAIRGGMREAMQDLAHYIIANKLSGDPIGQQAAPGRFTKPGDLAASILAGVRVGGNDEEVYGTLSGRPKNQPNLGYWQEFGTKHPAVAGKLRVFAGRDGQMVFTTSIAGFAIPPRPFLNPSLAEQKSQIMATIRARLSEANIS